MLEITLLITGVALIVLLKVPSKSSRLVQTVLAVVILTARVSANEPNLDSADYVKLKAGKLKDSSYVVQIAYVEESNSAGENATWYFAWTASGSEYTGSIPCFVPNELIERFVRKFGTKQKQGRRITTMPLKAFVRIRDEGAYLEVIAIYFTD